MLQQTQVERVIPFYTKFVKKFPTARALARAPLRDVLKSWQGLGYNRRAKFLHATAKELQDISFSSYRTELICDEVVWKLEKLPGVGPYTARAIAAFAYNQDVVFVETNIRTAVIHHFFNTAKERKGMIYHTSERKYHDAEIEKILKELLPKGKAREWYSALMDYGAYLKRSGVRINARTRGYTKQSKFAGSLREARGAILRALTSRERSPYALAQVLGPERRAQVKRALAQLCREQMVVCRRGVCTLPN